MGVESPLGENLSIALGTSDLTLLEITSAYGALANQGSWVRPTAIRYVLDSQHKLLEENTRFDHDTSGKHDPKSQARWRADVEARLTASASPRALKLPVGLSDSSLMKVLGEPI